MLSKKARRAIALVSITSVLSLHAVLPTAAPAAELLQEVLETVIDQGHEDDQSDWYIPGVRKFRCELIYESPSPEGQEFKSCAYNCRGYGAPANFPWPKELSCPVGYNELMPPIPSEYPSPYPDNSNPSILAD